MNKKVSLLMGMVLTTILAVSIVPSAYAGTWIYYDDGSNESSASQGSVGIHSAVKFTPPCSGTHILTARYYITGTPVSFNVTVLDSDGSTTLFGPLTVTPTSTGWFDVDLSSYGIRPSGDFYITMERTLAGMSWIGLDTTDPDGRSYAGTPGSWIPQINWDFMIRAEVECLPVGGVVHSPNELGLLSPLLMVTGLIGAIVIGAFVVKKRRI